MGENASHHVLGNLKRGLVFIVSAPAGTGKTTLVRMLLDEFPDALSQSISCTTRMPRKGEIDGKDYVFLKKEAFEKRVERGEFLEHAEVFGCHYGTLKETVEMICSSGRHAMLVIDTQGALALKKEIEATFIFIAPPKFGTLKKRLEQRDTETEHAMEKRLEWARHELDQVEAYDYLIVNDDLDTAYQVLKSIVIAEEHRLGKEK